MKRIFVVVLLFAALAALAFAGGKKEAAGAAAPIKLVYWDGEREGDWLTFFNELFDYGMKKSGVTVERIDASKGGPGGDALNLVAALAAGTGPAILNWAPIADFAVKGYIAPLDDYFTSWPDAKSLNPAVMKGFRFEGKSYAIPAMFNYCSPQSVYYNKTIAKKAGIDITKEPKTWAEYEAWAQKFAAAGYLSLLDRGQYADAFRTANGGFLFAQGADGKISCVLNTPQNVELYSWLQGLVKKGYVNMKERLSSQSYLDAFLTGKAGFMPEGFAQLGRSILPAGIPEADVGVIAFPTKDGVVKATNMGGGGSSINAMLPKDYQDAAWAFLSAIQGKEAYEKIIFPLQKKVDYRPVYLTGFLDQQAMYFETCGISPEWAKKLDTLAVNVQEPLFVPTGDIQEEYAAAIEGMLFEGQDVQKTLTELTSVINKKVVEPENKRRVERKFYQEMKAKQ